MKNCEHQTRKVLKQQILDLRITRNARWIDQKVTLDVTTIIADCIEQFALQEETELDGFTFTSRQLWQSSYAQEEVTMLFNKPDVDNPRASNEFDKFFHQPCKMLAYAGVLSESSGRSIEFTVENPVLLQSIAVGERNAYKFLCVYIAEVLQASDLWEHFCDFWRDPDQRSYAKLKGHFVDFILENTPINNVTEIRRIFIKVLNPLSCYRQSLGTKRGRISTAPITLDDLRYNKQNFRDLNNEQKRKNETRQEFVERSSSFQPKILRYEEQKSKRKVKARHNGHSELNDNLNVGTANVAHHIFMRSEYMELCDQKENLILLTAGQHLQCAHPAGNTHIVDFAYQRLCLLAKLESVLFSERNADDFYSLEAFINVLNTGLRDRPGYHFLPIDADPEMIRLAINAAYSQ